MLNMLSDETCYAFGHQPMALSTAQTLADFWKSNGWFNNLLNWFTYLMMSEYVVALKCVGRSRVSGVADLGTCWTVRYIRGQYH